MSQMVVLNASMEEHNTKVFGNWLHFKPGQIKIVSENLGKFLIAERRHLGFVSLPSEFEDPEYRLTPEGKRITEERTREGIQHRVKHLTEIANNNLISLKQDLRSTNLKTDPRALASSGERKAMELLVDYRSKDKDEEAAKIAEIERLEKELNLEDESED